MPSIWPLFDLRIRTEHLELRLPGDRDLAAMCAAAKAGIHDPDQMPFAVPWTRLTSPDFERSFVQFHWRQRGDWTPRAWTLELGVFLDGQAIGAQGLSARQFSVLRAVETGSWLSKAYQGRGLGKEMRQAVLALAFDHLGAEVATTSAFADNLASAGVSRAVGYRNNGIGRMAPEGVARDMVAFRMTRDDWQAVERPVVEVTGLGPCLELFGVS